MKLEIHAPASAQAAQPFHVRVILFNDSYEPAAVSRNGLIGPNVHAGQGLVPPHVEPTKGQPDEPLTLQPFTFYGREREIGPFAAGAVQVSAEYQDEQGQITETVTITVN